jgi:hypothetical protein
MRPLAIMTALEHRTAASMARIHSFIAGLGALASIWPATQPIRYPHRSSADALRSDAVRIGQDMRRVIERERAQLEAAKK